MLSQDSGVKTMNCDIVESLLHQSKQRTGFELWGFKSYLSEIMSDDLDNVRGMTTCDI